MNSKLAKVKEQLTPVLPAPPEANSTSTLSLENISKTAIQTLGKNFNHTVEENLHFILKGAEKIVSLDSNVPGTIKIRSLTPTFSESLDAMVASVVATGDPEPQVHAGSDIAATRALLKALQAANLKPKLMDPLTHTEITKHEDYLNAQNNLNTPPGHKPVPACSS